MWCGTGQPRLAVAVLAQGGVLTGSRRMCVALLPSMRQLGSRSYGVRTRILVDGIVLASARGSCSCFDLAACSSLWRLALHGTSSC